MTAMQLFLLFYLLLFYGIAFVWRSYQTWRATGVNPYRLKQGTSIERFTGKWYRFISIGVASTVLIYSLAPKLYTYLAPIQWLLSPVVRAGGIVLLLGSFVWVLVAQTNMGTSWRVGIDQDSNTALVTQGVFGLSRNPIFLGMRANLFGFFLVLPSALTLALWLLGDVLLQIQVCLEEAYLEQTHGAAYLDYCQRVRRWL